MQTYPPVLPLETWGPEFTQKVLTGLRVRAVMVYPDPHNSDKTLTQREAFIVSYIVRAIAFAEDAEKLAVAECLKAMLPPGSFRMLQHAPNWERFTYAHQRGMMAGDLLLYILHLDVLGLGGSFNKALKLLEDKYAQSTTLVGGRVPCSHASIKQAWGTYKPAAHLWAALSLVYDSFFSEHPPLLTREFLEHNFRWWCEDLSSFLVLAEALRQLGVARIPPNQRKAQQQPTLSPTETWSCMGSGEPREPGVRYEVTLDIPPLSEQEIAVLKAKFKSL